MSSVAERVGSRVEQEPESVSGSRVARFAAAAVAASVVAVVAASRLLVSFDSGVCASPVSLSSATFGTSQPIHAPAQIGIADQTLASRPGAGLERNRQEAALLHRYAWVDEAHTIARVPIERGIELFVAAEAKAAKDAGVGP